MLVLFEGLLAKSNGLDAHDMYANSQLPIQVLFLLENLTFWLLSHLFHV